MSAQDRPTRARLIAERIDWTPTYLAEFGERAAIVEQVLRLTEHDSAAEVRVLRAELDRVVAAHARCDSAARALVEVVESSDRAIYVDECADLRAALVARTPQLAGVDAVRAELYEFAPPPWEAINYEVHAGGELLFEALGEYSHEENSRIADVVVRFFNAVAPQPAVLDTEDPLEPDAANPEDVRQALRAALRGRDELGRRAAVARIVAEHWRDQALDGDRKYAPMEMRFMAHPLALVLTALDGETDPAQLGIDGGHVDAQRVREVAG